MVKQLRAFLAPLILALGAIALTPNSAFATYTYIYQGWFPAYLTVTSEAVAAGTMDFSRAGNCHAGVGD